MIEENLRIKFEKYKSKIFKKAIMILVNTISLKLENGSDMKNIVIKN